MSMPLNLVHYDKMLGTINIGLRILNSIPNPIIKFKQTISMTNPCMDASYIGMIEFNPDNIKINIPYECDIITNIRNTLNCRMDILYNNMLLEVTNAMQLNLIKNKNVSLIIYTTDKNVTVSYYVYMVKNKIKSNL
jgi:hypothetical protein